MTETEQTLLRLLEQAMKPPLICPSPVIRDLAQHEALPCGHPRACRDSDGICGWCYDRDAGRKVSAQQRQAIETALSWIDHPTHQDRHDTIRNVGTTLRRALRRDLLTDKEGERKI